MSGTILIAIAITSTLPSALIRVGDRIPPGSTVPWAWSLLCLKICQCHPELSVLDPLLIEAALELL
eukprot:12905628-Prorocentrum_lima.AAC.1